MKNMKKIITLVILISAVIPNLVLASWWNPLSWFASQKEDDFYRPVTSPIFVENQISQYGRYFIKFDNSRVRACGSLECDILGYYQKNDHVTIIGSEKWAELDEWVALKTTDSGQEGFLNKSVLSKTPVVSVVSPKPIQPTAPSAPILEEKTLSTAGTLIDRELLIQVVDVANTRNSEFKKALLEGIKFNDDRIYPGMAEYPNSTVLQRAGKDFLENDTRYSAVLLKMIDIQTKLVEELTLLLGSQAVKIMVPNKTNSRVSEIQPYLKEYSELADNIEPLIEAFVRAQRITLDNENNRLQGELAQKIQDAQTISNSVNQSRIEQYNKIRAQGASEGVTESVVNAQLNAAGLIKQINCYFSSVGGMTPSSGSVTCY